MRFITLISALVGLAAAYTQPDYSEDPKGNPITLPGLGDQVPAGKPYTITWTPTTQGKVSLVLLRGPSSNVQPIETLADGIENTGEFDWTPSTTLEPDVTHYGLLLVVAGTGQYQWSTQFGISNKEFSSFSESSSSAVVSESTSATATSAPSSSSSTAVTSSEPASTAGSSTHTATAVSSTAVPTTFSIQTVPNPSSTASSTATTSAASSGTTASSTGSSSGASGSGAAVSPSSSRTPTPTPTPSPSAKPTSNASGHNAVSLGAVIAVAAAVLAF